MTTKWYAKRAGGHGGQGLVIEEDTGRNVAVSYDEKDAPLLAAAPELLAALRYIVDHCRLYGPADRAREQARAAIAKATEGRAL